MVVNHKLSMSACNPEVWKLKVKQFETLSSQIGGLGPELQILEVSVKIFNVFRSLFISFYYELCLILIAF